MADQQYTYAVARIRSKELSLLDQSFLEQLLACKTYEECIHLLEDKGWDAKDSKEIEVILAQQREKTWALMRELVEDMSVFDTFLIGNDFHNLKAAIKEVYVNQEVPNIYISSGTVPLEIVKKAVEEHDFSLLPEVMRQAAEEAYQVQFHTGDSQLCDVIIDKATLEGISHTGRESGNELLAEYAELKVAAANIHIALRSYKTGKGMDFMERALAPCSSLDYKELARVALMGEEAIYEYLENTRYKDAVEEMKKSPAAFEKWCDNLIIRYIRPQKYNSFSLSPLAAYILARENEIKSIRILLSGKHNDLSEESIRERLREMYV